MTFRRTVKWITIGAGAAAACTFGAWLWARRVPAWDPFTATAGIVFDVYRLEDALYTGAEIGRHADGARAERLGAFAVSIGHDLTPAESDKSGRTPMWINERVHAYDRAGYDNEDQRLLAAGSGVTLAELLQLAERGLEADRMAGTLPGELVRPPPSPNGVVTSLNRPTTRLQREALRRGPGQRTAMFWPGVAHRVRDWMPIGVSVAGGVALLGGVTLLTHGFVVRRRVRRRGLCPHCGYDLRGLTAAVCPECGQDAPSPAPGAGGVAEGGHGVTEGADSK